MMVAASPRIIIVRPTTIGSDPNRVFALPSPAPIEPGGESLTLQVTVTFELSC